MSKEIKLGYAARLGIKNGINKAVAAVAPTLGAGAMAAIIEVPGLDPLVADDGVTIMRNLEFKDRYEQMGMLLARKVASQTSAKAGDGTSTSCILANALINEAFKAIGKDDSKIPSVLARLDEGLIESKVYLRGASRDVRGDDIRKIATISSLDPEIGDYIAGMIDEVGVDGVITAESSPIVGYSTEVVKGARIQSPLITPYLINERESARCELDEAVVILVDRSISTNKQVSPWLEHLMDIGKTNILIIADDIEGEALTSFVMNHQRKIIQVACVKNPYTAHRSKEFLEDIAVLTGATVISEKAGKKLEEINIDDCGSAERVTSGEHETTIVGGYGKQEDIDTRVRLIEAQIKDTEVASDREELQKRIATLKGGIGVIRVGAYTDIELKAKKYKIENAINSTKSALEEGVVTGGGITTYNMAYMVKEPIFNKALKAPLLQMAKTAGKSPKKFIKGINTDEVMDAHKVQRLALENAVSIAKQAVTIGTAIVNEE